MKEKEIIGKNINIKVKDKIIIHDFSFSLCEEKSIVVLGYSGSGKTTLLKYLKENIKEKYKIEFYFNEESKTAIIEDEFKEFSLSKEEKEFISIFCKNKNNIKFKIALLKKVFMHPDFIFIDDLRNILTYNERKIFFSFLKALKITSFYVTSCVEDLPFFFYTIVLQKNQIAVEGKTNLVVKEEKLMKVLGYSIPFYVNMSLQLELYGLLDEISYDKEKMEELLWK